MAGNTTANLSGADAYIDSFVIVSEDWDDCDPERKIRIINVAQRSLVGKYADYTIPDEAIYEYCAVLATSYNDTNKLGRQGVSSMSIAGAVSFTFNQHVLIEGDALIPKAAVDMINAEPDNATLPKLSAGRAVKWTVM
jgi:hypothetical protein